MARRREKLSYDYVDPRNITPRSDPPDIYEVVMAVPAIVLKAGDSAVKRKEEKPDWSLYKVVMRNGNPFIVRETCDRCGKVWVPPSHRRVRAIDTETCGMVYLETGICNDCINASIYMDKYFVNQDFVGSFNEEVKLFNATAMEYERAWRAVISGAPSYLMTEDEWQKRCNYFNGCAMCGGPIEVRAMFFPRYLNGTYSPWNVIPLCADCHQTHYLGRTTKNKKITRFKVFCGQQHFNKFKEIRVYLLNVMDKYDIYKEPLTPFRKQFFEVLKLEDKFV